jgi:hypothetical protein
MPNVSMERHTIDKENGPARSRPMMTKKRKAQAMMTIQAIRPQNETEEAVKGWLKTKSAEELRQFLSTSWVASLLSAEAIEELHEELQQQEAVEYASEMGLD